jgi:hypothetical protein
VEPERKLVPLIVSVWAAAPAVAEVGKRLVIVGTGLFGAVTVTVALPDLVVSCVEVAVIVAAPVPLGVKTPDEVIAPSVAAQVTAEL